MSVIFLQEGRAAGWSTQKRFVTAFSAPLTGSARLPPCFDELMPGSAGQMGGVDHVCHGDDLGRPLSITLWSEMIASSRQTGTYARYPGLAPCWSGPWRTDYEGTVRVSQLAAEQTADLVGPGSLPP